MIKKEKSFKGGEFLITDALPEEVFTPEDFTQEQRLVAKSAEDFIVGEVADRKDELEDELNPELLKELLRKEGELGFLSTEISESYGGSDMDKVSTSLIMEKFSNCSHGFSVTHMVQTGIGSLPIVLFGNAEQKKKYLPKLASGEMVGAFALTEPEAGSDALSAKTTAVLSEDKKYYILNGQKQFITNAGFADVFSTYAQLDGKFTSFIVEKNCEGLSLDPEEKKMGCHGSSTRPVIFQDAKVPVENLLGEIGKGHVVALNTLNVGRYKAAASMVGFDKTLLAEAIQYAKTRVQFGKPICNFGLIKNKIADIVVTTYITESMVYRTARLLDFALEGIDKTADDAGKKIGDAIRDHALECSINKVFSTETCNLAADECVQLMGGYGFVQDSFAEATYRDVRIQRIWEGTNEINRVLVVEMLLRASKAGTIALSGAIKRVKQELADNKIETGAKWEQLENERDMLSRAKKIVLLVMGCAIGQYGDALPREQEVVGLLSDMIIGIFAMESGLLRSYKKVKKEGAESSRIQQAVAQVFMYNTFPRIVMMAEQALAAIFDGEALANTLTDLKKLAGFTPVNTVALRREIAESAIGASRYHLTKI